MVYKILGISGSLRADSHNTALLRAAQRFAPEGVELSIFNRLRDIPPYDQDLEAGPAPEPVADLRQQITEADGLLIATPEYNYSIPGVLKNALDWASRPYGAASLAGKPVAITGASPTPFGSVRAQLALRQVFVWTNSPTIAQPEVIVASSHEHFDADGNLTNERTQQQLSALLTALAERIRLHEPALVG